MSVKRDNMSLSNILLFTDLDGTLLNKKTFEFKAALNLIKNCISKGINIIPNSSKTDLELDEICENLEIPKVYISENGSFIYGLNYLSKKLNEKVYLSRDKAVIFKNFSDNINVKLQKKCLILENETLKNQIEVLGLPQNKISKAMNRKFSMPFIFLGNKDEEIELKKNVKKNGLNIQFGGRVLSLGDKVSKGDAMMRFISLLSNETKKNYVSICVGDNENDFDMLDKCDYPCLVKNGPLKNINFKNQCVFSKKEAPDGWVEVVNKTLNIIKEVRSR
jgi:mannosyl-3-phosphoglycerate phosphatase